MWHLLELDIFLQMPCLELEKKKIISRIFIISKIFSISPGIQLFILKFKSLKQSKSNPHISQLTFIPKHRILENPMNIQICLIVAISFFEMVYYEWKV